MGIDLSTKAIDLVKLRLDGLLGTLYRPDMVTARTDIPRRTDVGKLPPYKTPRHTLYPDFVIFEFETVQVIEIK